jgi:hypothetical protein
MAGVPLVYKIHTLSAWAILGLWPFSRLVHAWSIPLQYVGRPYILYRRRCSRPGLRTRIAEPTPHLRRTDRRAEPSDPHRPVCGKTPSPLRALCGFAGWVGRR